MKIFSLIILLLFFINGCFSQSPGLLLDDPSTLERELWEGPFIIGFGVAKEDSLRLAMEVARKMAKIDIIQKTISCYNQVVKDFFNDNNILIKSINKETFEVARYESELEIYESIILFNQDIYNHKVYVIYILKFEEVKKIFQDKFYEVILSDYINQIESKFESKLLINSTTIDLYIEDCVITDIKDLQEEFDTYKIP